MFKEKFGTKSEKQKIYDEEYRNNISKCKYLYNKLKSINCSKRSDEYYELNEKKYYNELLTNLNDLVTNDHFLFMYRNNLVRYFFYKNFIFNLYR